MPAILRSGGRPMVTGLPQQWISFRHALLMLPIAAALAAALGVIRPIRRTLVRRSSHVVQRDSAGRRNARAALRSSACGRIRDFSSS
jgi:hypothetical protein